MMNNYQSPIRVNSYLQQNTNNHHSQSVGKQMPANVSFERPNSQAQGQQQIQLNGYNFSQIGGINPKGTTSESPQRPLYQQQQIINNQQIKLESLGIQKDNTSQIISQHNQNGYLKKKQFQAAKKHLSSQVSQQLFSYEIKGLNPSHNIFCDQSKGNQLRTSTNHANPFVQQRINGFQQSVLQNKALYNNGQSSNVNASLLSQQLQKIDLFARSTYFVRPIQELVQLNTGKGSLDPNESAMTLDQQRYNELSPQLIPIKDLNQQHIDFTINKSLTIDNTSQFTMRNYANEEQAPRQDKRDSLSIQEQQQTLSITNRKLSEDQQKYYPQNDDFQDNKKFQRVILKPAFKTESNTAMGSEMIEGFKNEQIYTPQNVNKTKRIQNNPHDISCTENKKPIKQTEIFRISSPLKYIKSNAQISYTNSKIRSISQDPSFQPAHVLENSLKPISKDKEYQLLSKQGLIVTNNIQYSSNNATLMNSSIEKQNQINLGQTISVDEKERMIFKSLSGMRRNLPDRTSRSSNPHDILNKTQNVMSMYQSQNAYSNNYGNIRVKYSAIQFSKKQRDDKIDLIMQKCTNKTYFDPAGDMRNELLQQKHANTLLKNNQESKLIIQSEKTTPKSSSIIPKFIFSANEVTVNDPSKKQQSNQKSMNKIQNENDGDNSDSDSSNDLDVDSDEEEEDDEPDNDDNIDQMFVNTAYQPSSECSSQFKPPLLQPNRYNKLLLLKSVYENRPPTVFFPYPPHCGEIIRNSSRTVVATDYEEKRFDMRFKVTTNSLNRCIGNAFQYAGIRETEDYDWNIKWGTGRDNKVKNMMKYQKVNHFPQCWNMGRKDCLWKNLSKVKRKFPQEYDFIPNTYILQHQSDWDRFLAKRDDAEKGKLWIMKPSNQAQGKNIKMISKKSRVQRKQEYIICEYVANPHLIDGLKYDLRIYVLVTSYDPLRIYIFDDGLTRFATEKYSTNTKELSKRYVHLTNYSLNKNNPKFQQNQDATADSVGSKWSLKALFRKYEELGVNTTQLWDRIKDLIIKTCIAAEPYMTDQYVKCENHRSNCFELYGFDVLIDDTLKPWLLEVNVRPSLSSSSPLDRKIKNILICDTFNLIGIQPYDKKKYEDDQKKRIPGVPDQKRGFSKNLKEIQDIDENNSLQKLSPEDWNVIFETDEENYRTGHFERIFPPAKDKIDYYLRFFEYERYNNIIIRSWIKSSSNFLEKILKKKYDFNV